MKSERLVNHETIAEYGGYALGIQLDSSIEPSTESFRETDPVTIMNSSYNYI